jgi:hypothetical protein
VRLKRLNQAAFFLGVKIVLNGGGARECVRSSGSGGGSRLLEIENGAKRFAELTADLK